MVRSTTMARGAVLRPLAVAVLTTAALAQATAIPANAQEAAPCSANPAYSALDFWAGDWTVWVGDQQVGTNRIIKVMGGCAIEEHWEDARGGAGQSLFYYLPAEGEWRQVWVTPNATRPGGVKEKRQVDAPDGSIRFQGTITHPDGTTYLDRTTLTPDDLGDVRQHIEISTDGGESWRTTFDAEYRPAG